MIRSTPLSSKKTIPSISLERESPQDKIKWTLSPVCYLQGYPLRVISLYIYAKFKLIPTVALSNGIILITFKGIGKCHPSRDSQNSFGDKRIHIFSSAKNNIIFI
jgi:hypothetical protein